MPPTSPDSSHGQPEKVQPDSARNSGNFAVHGWFRNPRNLPWALALFAVVYCAVAALGNTFYFEPEIIAAFWPASGLFLAALLVSRTRNWPFVSGTAVLAHASIEAVAFEIGLVAAIVTALAAALEALVAATLLRRMFRRRFSLLRLDQVVAFSITGLAAAALAALPGTAILVGGFDDPGFWTGWRTWWLADALGLLVVAPVIILFTPTAIARLAKLRGWKLVELAIVITTIGAAQLFMERTTFAHATPLDVPYAIFPILVWAAVRFPPWVASVFTLLIAMIVVANTDLGRGPFVLPGLRTPQEILALQVFLGVAAFLVLSLCAVLAESVRIETARRSSDSRYRTLFKAATDGVLVLSGDRVVDCNARILQTLHLSRNEVVGKTPWELSPPKQPDGADSKTKAQRILREIAQGATNIFEWRHQGGNGVEVDFDIGIAATEVIDGQSLTFAFLRDITQRKQASLAIAAALQFETLLADLSANFVNIPVERVNHELAYCLGTITEHLDLDRACLFVYDSEIFNLTHHWTREGIPEGPFRKQAATTLPYFRRKILEGEPWLVEDVDQMPPEAAAYQKILREQGERSFVALPLTRGNATLGVLLFGSFRHRIDFSTELIQRLRLVADLCNNILARKEADKNLRESEQKFRTVFEHADIGFTIRRSSDLSLIAANPTYQDMTGYSEQELQALPAAELLAPTEHHRLRQVEGSSGTATPFSFDALDLVRKDGSTLTVAGSFIPITVDGVGQFVGISRDISKQLKAEMNLRSSEEKFSKAFDTSPDSLIITSLDEGRILDINQSFQELFGFSKDEAVGRTTTDLEIWVDLADQSRLRQDISTGAGRSQFRCRLRLKSGEVRIAEVAAVRLELSGKTAILTIGHDVTDRERDRKALQASEEKFFKAFQANPSSSAITNLASGKILDVNRAFCRITGYKRQEVVGTAAAELDNWRPRQELEEIVQRLRHGEDVVTTESRFHHRDGSEFAMEVSSVIIDIGNEECLLTVGRDLTERIRAEELRERAFVEIQQLKEELEQERDYLREEVKTALSIGEIVGESPALQKVLAQISAVAPTDATVLIQGESGVGKELVAAAIHGQSLRRAEAMVRVNCAAVPRELFESEFFGHLKGAFTGASRNRIGRFQLAHRGTLFLDEITEIPLELQSKLLRVLQEGEIQRVGDESSRKVDVRLIAATNHDLERAVEEGRFRRDLYYRLNVFALHVPPLRDRGDDVVMLAQHFIAQVCRELKREPLALSRYQARLLTSYDWPGNVRELRNVVERAVILSSGKRLHFEVPRPEEQLQADSGASPPKQDDTSIVSYSELRRRERENLLAALEAASWKVSGAGGAAELLGIRPSTLASKMKALGISKPRTP